MNARTCLCFKKRIESRNIVNKELTKLAKFYNLTTHSNNSNIRKIRSFIHGNIDAPDKMSPTIFVNIESTIHKIGAISEKSMEKLSGSQLNYDKSQKKKYGEGYILVWRTIYCKLVQEDESVQ